MVGIRILQSKLAHALLFPSSSVAWLVTKPFTNAVLFGIVRKYFRVTEQD